MKKGIIMGVMLSLVSNFTYVAEPPSELAKKPISPSPITKQKQKKDKKVKEETLLEKTLRDVNEVGNAMKGIANAERNLAQVKEKLFPPSDFANGFSIVKYFCLGGVIGVADACLITKAQEDNANRFWWIVAVVAGTASGIFDQKGNLILHPDYSELSVTQKAMACTGAAVMGGVIYYCTGGLTQETNNTQKTNTIINK
jgi:hypothetical protein